MRRLTGVVLAGMIGTLMRHDPALAIFAVIFLEEMGVPLPLPGDLFIVWVGALIAMGRIGWPAAVVAIVAGAVLGACALFMISRRFGAPLIHRYGAYLHLYPPQLETAERGFHRWGLWAVIFGRHIPGMRVVLSAIAGLLRFELPLFALGVLVSATAWALVFLAIGVRFGRQLRPLMHIPPAHLLPWLVFALLILTATGYVLRQRLVEGGQRVLLYSLRLGRGNDSR